jgi:ferredoxin-NADP reductase
MGAVFYWYNASGENMKLRDFKYFFKKHQVTVKNVNIVADDFRLIEFDIPKGLEWRAGQHGFFSFGQTYKDAKKEYPYSISSIQSEGVLRIAVKIYPPLNGYKEKMLSLQKGDQVTMRGPVGPVTLQDSYSPVVAIAGGIGITPLRALLKQAVHHHEDQIFHLIYASEQEYIYEEDLKELIKDYPTARIDFVRGVDDPKELTVADAKKYGNKAYYYISGGKRMILAYEKMLQAEGIQKKRIFRDPFYRF